MIFMIKLNINTGSEIGDITHTDISLLNKLSLPTCSLSPPVLSPSWLDTPYAELHRITLSSRDQQSRRAVTIVKDDSFLILHFKLARLSLKYSSRCLHHVKYQPDSKMKDKD